MNKTFGFSLIEAIIATVLLGVLLAAVLGPIGGLFKISKSNQQTLGNTTLAHQVAERIVKSWEDPAKFSGGCLDLVSEPLPAGVRVAVQDLDAYATPVSMPQPLSNCPGTTSSAPMRRVLITAANGGPVVEVTMDVAKPFVAGGGGP